ncbi:A-kinase anchor protein SPHKAP [Lampris incognitus]|uniref:A-kinase anchor protein SPHKAP n=1 Tax=Lampris incognitus TaxID=2546036 RepID=UPI0024B5384C|nr:A-kinase anchor protein SPHKAP [Lampris incognitus]
MAGAKCLLKMPSNFQSSAMFEGSESTEAERVSTEVPMASSVTVCKKVLCSNSVLDSSEYWLSNEKALCRVGLLEDNAEGSLTTVCFVNQDQRKMDRLDDRSIKRLALVSPDLPKLVESPSVQQPKENEILLLGGLEPPVSSQPHPHSPFQQQQRGTDVCLVQCSGQRRPTQLSSIIFEIKKFLISLQWGKDRQTPHGRAAGQRMDDDTNRSISSIEEDFLTASEHLGDDSEDDGFRNEPESGGMPESLEEVVQKHCIRLACQRGQLAHHQDREDCELTARAPTKKGGIQRAKLHTKESAGHYATNLAESVLQDAFIHLSQDETSFIPEAAVSVSPISCPSNSASSSQAKKTSRQHTCSFELPKIVIVQSPDSSEGAAEWPGTQASQLPDQGVSVEPRQVSEHSTQQHNLNHNGEHPTKPLELALACAASVIGTITTPQLTEQLTMESASEEETEEELQEAEVVADYSFSSAMCGMAQVAGAVAAVDLTEESGEGGDSDTDSGEVYMTSQGLLSAAEASAAFTLHCSMAEGTSIEAFRANISEVLHREAAEVLAQPHGYKSVAHLLEATHKKILEGITCSKKSFVDETEVDDFISEVTDTIFKHALEKAKKRKELEGPGKDAPNLQVFLQESVNSLLFDILCLTQRKISDISKCEQGAFDLWLGDICTREAATIKESRKPSVQLQHLVGYSHSNNNNESQSVMPHYTDKMTIISGKKEEKDSDASGSTSSAYNKEQHKQGQIKCMSISAKDCSDHQQIQQGKGALKEPLSEISVMSTEKRGRFGVGSDNRQSSLTPQSSFNSCSSQLSLRMDSESRTPITCFADDLATTVVSMATELAAICLENSTGKQPWFCALKGTSGEGPEAYLLPACRTVLRRKEGQNGSTASKKHRAPRLSEIKRKTEEQPELMERLVNRVVDETVNPDEPQDPFALFASEVTARIMNCPELNVVDTSKAGQPRNRLQCERWSRGKASSYESIPEEDADPSGTPNTLGPGSRLGQNLSRGSSISKQSSCESITDEFSRFMVNQMETEGRGFDLLLDYYAGKNASNILAAAVQQAASKKNGHLNVRASSCLSKQSSTESITEEFYRFMLRDMDKENKEYGIAKTREWSNSLLPPSPRTPFCIRQSSVPDRRSSDSRLTVNSPIKANSFDGFARNVHGDTLNIYPTSSVSATGLCKSDSCLYQRGKTDQITDMLIHETWSSSIESLMRKNKIIAYPEDSIELEAAGDSQPHVQQFANRLAADIVETGKSALGGQQDGAGATFGSQPQSHMPVGVRREGFKQSRPSCNHIKATQVQDGTVAGGNSAPRMRGPRDVPMIHIEGDQKDEETFQDTERAGLHLQDMPPEVSAPKRMEIASLASNGSSERDRPAVVVAAVVKRDKRSMSASSEESMGSWSHITPEDDPHEETSSFIQLSEGNGTSSASSLGLADLDAFSDVPTQSTVISKETEKGNLMGSRENVLEPDQHDNLLHSNITKSYKKAAKSAERDIITPKDKKVASDLKLDDCIDVTAQEQAFITLKDHKPHFKNKPTCRLINPTKPEIGVGSSSPRELLVVNWDLELECVDSELRMALQWIAASELGLSVLYFKKSKEKKAPKFQRVVHLLSQKAWRIADLFRAVVQFCELHEKEEDEGGSLSSLFDWLLETF